MLPPLMGQYYILTLFFNGLPLKLYIIFLELSDWFLQPQAFLRKISWEPKLSSLENTLRVHGILPRELFDHTIMRLAPLYPRQF